jgi:hypothetical protein
MPEETMAEHTAGPAALGPEDDDAPEFGEPTPLSPVARAAWIVGAVLLFAGAFLLITHAAFPRVNPAQKAPSGHYPGACIVCHTVTADVPVRAKK